MVKLCPTTRKAVRHRDRNILACLLGAGCWAVGNGSVGGGVQHSSTPGFHRIGCGWRRKIEIRKFQRSMKTKQDDNMTLSHATVSTALWLTAVAHVWYAPRRYLPLVSVSTPTRSRTRTHKLALGMPASSRASAKCEGDARRTMHVQDARSDGDLCGGICIYPSKSPSRSQDLRRGFRKE